MADYDLLSLRLFASVVESKSIALAAKTNNIAASAVSKRISDLEARANVVLLYRQREGVEPTAAGQALYRHVRTLLKLISRLDVELGEYAGGAKGTVRMFANTSAVTQFLPEDIAEFVRRHPDVRIDLREETSSRNIEAVGNGSADLAIFSEHVPHAGLKTRIYRRDSLFVVTPKTHPIASRSSVKLTDTLSYDHVGLQEGSSLQSKVKHESSFLGGGPRLRVMVLSFDAIRRMVEAGLGIAILPLGAVAPYLDSMQINAVELDEPWATRSLLLGFRDLATLPLVCRKLVEHLAPGE